MMRPRPRHPLLALLLLPLAAFAGITIDPPVTFFPKTPFGSTSESARLTVTNDDDGSSGVLGTATIEGDSGDYRITGDTCSGQSLMAGGSCYVDIAFSPQATGTRTAVLLFDGSYPLAAFLSDHEDVKSEALRRMPPVLDTLTITQDGVSIGKANGIDLTRGEITFEWTMLGYHDAFTAIIALFDCPPGDTSGSCGADYVTHVHASGALAPQSITQGEWSYGGIKSKVYRYRHTFDPSGSALASGGRSIIRFYRKNDLDALLGNDSISLLLPGDLDGDYYDTSGRRLSIDIK